MSDRCEKQQPCRCAVLFRLQYIHIKLIGDMDVAAVLMVFAVLAHLDGVFSDFCDFEDGLCGWNNDPANDVRCGWTLRKGLGVTPDSGPFADHTYGTVNGTYLYFQSSYCLQSNGDNQGHVGVSLAIDGFVQEKICAKFWYQMYGNGEAFVFFLLQQTEQEGFSPVFERYGNQGRSWKFAQVSIEQITYYPYSLTFAAVTGDASRTMALADIALDDIDILDGQCEPAADLCDFERDDLCGFNVTTATNGFQWNQDTAANASIKAGIPGFFTDHTLLYFNGRVAYASSHDSNQGDTIMVSPLQNGPETEQCLTFYYYIFNMADQRNVPSHNESTVSLSVYILTKGQRKVTCAWTAVDGDSFLWEYATVSISLKDAYQYSFVGSMSNNSIPLLLLDDISVQKGPCPQKLTCTFTNGSLCGWSIADGSAVTWLAEEPYPNQWPDASNIEGTPTAEEGYIFLDSKYGGAQTTQQVFEGTIVSQRLSPTDASWCFAFAYRLMLQGNSTAKLTVELLTLPLGGREKNIIFSTSNRTDGMWVDVQLDLQPVPKVSEFYLTVTGQVSEDAEIPSRIELDNFLLLDHSCGA